MKLLSLLSGRRWWHWLGLLLACYFFTCLALILLEDRLVYRPNSRGGYWAPAPADLKAEEIWLDSEDGAPIHAWWCPVQQAQGAVLFCHGNAGNLSQRSGDVRTLQAGLGRSVLIFDYPGFGKSGGSPSEAGCRAAANAAYRWLSRSFEPNEIVLVGQSLGGGCATDLASRKPGSALVLFKTFTSIPDVAQHALPLAPWRWLMRNRYDNLDKIARCTDPVFIAHGERDHLIPIAQAYRLFEAAPGPKKFLLLPGAGHHGSFDQDVMAEVADFLATASTSR